MSRVSPSEIFRKVSNSDPGEGGWRLELRPQRPGGISDPPGQKYHRNLLRSFKDQPGIRPRIELIEWKYQR